MADFTAHIDQAKRNLDFLEKINELPNNWDWKVIVAFYSALHLINAHIFDKEGTHYRSHRRTDEAINPFNKSAASSLAESDYLAYRKLLNLSRRARYLIHENESDTRNDTFLTYDKHYSKALRHLNTILVFMNTEYSVNYTKIKVICPELKKSESFIAYNL